MKKALLFILAALMLFSVLAGCGKSEEDKAREDFENALKSEMGEEAYKQFQDEMKQAADYEKDLQDRIENGVVTEGEEKELIEIDPFDESIFGEGKTVSYEYSNIEPFIWFDVSNHAAYGDPILNIKYTADKGWDLKNGDVVTITASIPNLIAQNTYTLTRTEMTVTIENMDVYVTDVSQLTDGFLQEIANKVYAQDAETANSDVYDGEYTYSPGTCDFEDIRVGDTAFLLIKEQEETRYLIVPISKTVICREWYDADSDSMIEKRWEDVVAYYTFTDLVIHTDGTFTCNMDDIGYNGNYSDEGIGDNAYLAGYRDFYGYSFFDVKMP